VIVEWEGPFWYKDEFFALYGEFSGRIWYVASYGDITGETLRV